MEIKIIVSPEAAIKAGKATAGIVPITITEDILARLSDTQRATLAECVDTVLGSVVDGWGGAPQVADASVESLAILLDWRADKIARRQNRAQK